MAGLALNLTFTRTLTRRTPVLWHGRGPGLLHAGSRRPDGPAGQPDFEFVVAGNRALAKPGAGCRDALRLIDRTVALTALAAVAGCGFAILFRYPAIALFFQRGSFTAESTRMVAEVFLGMAPSLVGWTLIEIMSRSLFALNRPWPPVIASAIPLLLNVTLTLRVHSHRPELIGLGSSIGLLAGFAALFAMTHMGRQRWLKQG